MLPVLQQDVTATVALGLMIVAATSRKRLRWRAVRCPVCRRVGPSCTCRFR